MESQSMEVDSENLEAESESLASYMSPGSPWDFENPCWARAKDLEFNRKLPIPDISSIDAALSREQHLSYCCRCHTKNILYSWQCNGPCQQRTYCIACVMSMHPGIICKNKSPPVMVIRASEETLPESSKLISWSPDWKMQCGFPGCDVKTFEKNEYAWICQQCPRKCFHNQCWAYMHPLASLTAPNRSGAQWIQEAGDRDLSAEFKYPSECYSCPRCKGPVMPVKTTRNDNRMAMWKCIGMGKNSRPCMSQFVPRGNICIDKAKGETFCDFEKNNSCNFSGTNFCTSCVIHKPPGLEYHMSCQKVMD